MRFNEAVEAVEKHALTILAQPDSNIRLLAVGSKDRLPLADASDFCVTAYVPEKLTEARLKRLKIAPFQASFARAAGEEALEKIRLDVVESGTGFVPLQGLKAPVALRGQYGGTPPVIDTQKFFHELRCGIGLANPTREYPDLLSAGTLGFFVRDGNGQLYLVSNSHVIGRSGDAKAGEVVVQPGTLDLTTVELQSMNTLAKLRSRLAVARVRAVVPFRFAGDSMIPINRVDAAIATVDEEKRGVGEVDRVGFGGAVRGVAEPYRVASDGSLIGSTRVHKVGRTTGATEGTIVGLAGTGMIPYPGGSAFFAGQLVIEATPDNDGAFSDRGDSGSAILNDQHELVGLLFAGSERQTLANPIGDVLRELEAASGLSLSAVTG